MGMANPRSWPDIVVRVDASGVCVFDTSDFHSLGHAFLDCPSKRRHLSLWWTYFGREALEFALIGRPRRATLCRIGVHAWVPFWHSLKPDSLPAGIATGQICDWCEVLG